MEEEEEERSIGSNSSLTGKMRISRNINKIYVHESKVRDEGRRELKRCRREERKEGRESDRRERAGLFAKNIGGF